MCALFAHLLKKVAGKFGSILKRVSVSLRLVGQPVADNVERINFVLTRERTDIALPLNHGATYAP